MFAINGSSYIDFEAALGLLILKVIWNMDQNVSYRNEFSPVRTIIDFCEVGRRCSHTYKDEIQSYWVTHSKFLF